MASLGRNDLAATKESFDLQLRLGPTDLKMAKQVTPVMRRLYITLKLLLPFQSCIESGRVRHMIC